MLVGEVVADEVEDVRDVKDGDIGACDCVNRHERQKD